MRVIHVVSSVAESQGGPSRSVPELCEALVRRGCEVELCCLDLGDKHGPIARVDESIDLHFARSWTVKSARVVMPRGFRSLMRSRVGGADLIHVHGVWDSAPHQAAQVAREAGLPYLITTRGMLEPWCLKFSAWKKRLAMCLYQRKDLRQAACIHSTAKLEEDNLREVGLVNPIAVIPNGLYVDRYHTDRQVGAEAVGHWPQLQGKRICLFLSRIHPKKGLLDLAKAWGKLCKKFPDWRVVIAGPDEYDHTQEVQAAMKAEGAEDSTLFVGSVTGSLKTSLLSASDLFVLPTHSENFGIVVAEALASGSPAITTKGAPWGDMVDHQCGWWTDIGPEPLTEAMEEAMALSESEREQMGLRGRDMIEQRYSWLSIASQMITVYEWLLGSANRPDCVHMK